VSLRLLCFKKPSRLRVSKSSASIKPIPSCLCVFAPSCFKPLRVNQTYSFVSLRLRAFVFQNPPRQSNLFLRVFVPSRLRVSNPSASIKPIPSCLSAFVTSCFKPFAPSCFPPFAFTRQPPVIPLV
jgi:hypothetical protein